MSLRTMLRKPYGFPAVAGPRKKKHFYNFGDYRLNATDRVLERNGCLVPLMPKVADTLTVLVGRAGEIVDKEELMRSVWPDTFVVESSLTRNISVLRSALQARSGTPRLIETIPKRGYRFTAPVSESWEKPGQTPAVAAPPKQSGLGVTFIGMKWRWGAIAAVTILLTVGGTGFRTVSDPTPQRIRTAVSPRNNEAERHYRIGRYLWGKITPASVGKSVAWFERAIQLNPTSALAHAGLADALVVQGDLGLADPGDLFPRAKKLAEMAVSIDPQLPAAHASLGMALLLYDWNWKAAEVELRRAISLDPKFAPGYHRYAWLLAKAGRFNESKRMIRKALDLDPVSPLIGAHSGAILYLAREYERAVLELRAVLDREPSCALARYYLARCYAHLGLYDEAFAELQHAEIPDRGLLNDRAWLYARSGNLAKAEEIFAGAKRLVDEGAASESSLLMLYLALGKNKEALDAYEIAIAEHQSYVLNGKTDPRLDPLRSDPRFASLIRRTGLTP